MNDTRFAVKRLTFELSSGRNLLDDDAGTVTRQSFLQDVMLHFAATYRLFYRWFVLWNLPKHIAIVEQNTHGEEYQLLRKYSHESWKRILTL